MPSLRSRALFCVALFFFASAASARIVSYAPYTNRNAWPLMQARTNRYFVLYEDTTIGSGNGQLVRYDSTGAEEPAVIYPASSGANANVTTGAVREHNGTSTILIQLAGNSWLLSTDSGANWKKLDLPSGYAGQFLAGYADNGGPWARSRYSQVRIGNDATPFVVATSNALYGVDAGGTTRIIVPPAQPVRLAGSNIDGTQFLIVTSNTNVFIVDLAGHTTKVATVTPNAAVEGWITPANDTYIETHQGGPTLHQIVRISSTNAQRVLAENRTDADAVNLFAVPSSDFSSAWIIQRGAGKPTVLLKQTGENDPAVQWSDVTASEVEALHAGASGSSLLVQVHRPRVVDQSTIFRDPALAIWHTGEGAPRAYDELFMNEQGAKGFVHLEVDKLAAGEPFVFDSGVQQSFVPSPVSGPIAPPPTSGGSDVLQEWGVVRASLSQKLVLPGMSHIDGAFGSHWQSDVVLYNPLDAAQKVAIDYVPTGDTVRMQSMTLTLAAKEIRVVRDALLSLFGVTAGGGAFFITPESGVNVTSRTYTSTDKGTFGFSMNGIDFYAAAAGPRFPVTFSGAFPGSTFRTNVVITDTSGRGTDTASTGAGLLGTMGYPTVFSAPPNGQQQYNGISTSMGLSSGDNGALVIAPTHGTAIASVIAIDNRTNDPTYFPPDIPASIVRTIPALGHLDGANGSKFRSDLYLYNPSSIARTIALQVKAWDSNEFIQPLSFTLLAGEARVIPDALQRLFGRTGIARLRFQSNDGVAGQGIRVTSRTYSIDENGGTYGFLMPPLNNFQIAGSGDTLEILGVVGGSGFRTNLGLVDTTAFPSTATVQAKVEVIDDKGKTIDSFTLTIPAAGGMQINDLFHARGLGDGPAAALIRVSPISGAIGAYATMNDNGTNDPTYLAANLAAH